MNPKMIAADDGLRYKKNVISISSGTKTTNNIDTNEPCAVIGVIKKEGVDNLSSNDIIPSILSDGVTKTDVIEVNQPTAHSTCPTNTSGACDGHDDLYHSARGGSQIMGSAGTYSSGRTWFGTFAAIVRDNDGKLVGLTNNHVAGMTYDTTNGYNWGLTPTDNDTYNHKSVSPICLFPNSSDYTIGQTLTHGHGTDYGHGGSIARVLGTVKRIVPLIFDPSPPASVASNYCDAAIFDIDQSGDFWKRWPSPIIIDTVSIHKHSNTAPIFDFSQLPIDNHYLYPCVKVGRTTGRTVLEHDRTFYDPTSGQYASIVNEDVDISVSYISTKSSGCAGFARVDTENEAWFSNLISIKYYNADDDWRFSYSGDSGSLCWIWNPNNDRWEVLGLIFAGGCDNDDKNCISYVCRMDYILKQLQIGEGWTNDISIGSDTPSLYSYIGTDSTVILPDVSACTGLWDGDINVDSDEGTGDFIQVQYDPREPTICYEKVSGSPDAPIHEKSDDFIFTNTTSGFCTEFHVGLTTLGTPITTVDTASLAVSTVYTINGVSATELHLDRGVQYHFILDDTETRSGGAHPFQIVDNWFNISDTFGPETSMDLYFTAPLTGAGEGYMNYTCINHGPNMGNFIHFR